MQALIYQRLIQVFSILSFSVTNNAVDEAKSYLLRFLLPLLGDDARQQVLSDFEAELKYFNDKLSRKRIASNSVKLMKFAEQLNAELSLEEKHFLFIRVFEFSTEISVSDPQVFDYVDLLRDMLNVSEDDLFVIEQACSSQKPLVCFSLDGREVYCRINDSEGLIDDVKFPEKMIFRFDASDFIELDNGEFIDYSEVRKRAGVFHNPFDVFLENLNLSLSDKIHLFNGLEVTFQSPGMVAVLGRSGAGKSSLMKVLAGVLKLDDGHVCSSKPLLSVSFMPQEDNIAPERNLMNQLLALNSKYGLGKSKADMLNVVDSVDLREQAFQIPGEGRNSKLSGGERKRAGLCCALLNDPDLLLCDEPTSGLSSQDAELLIKTLRNTANQGRLVIASLHQPEMNLLRYFERVLYLDEKGTPVFFGFPDKFYEYVSTQTGRKVADSGLLRNLQNDLSRTEALIQLKDESGERKFKPEFWKERFGSDHVSKSNCENEQKPVTLKKQRLRFFPALLDDLKSVFARKSFAVLSVLYAPVMAVLLSLVCRHSTGDDYNALQNVHMPVFFLMSIVVAVFGGLVLSVSEISREQSVRKREILLDGHNRLYFAVKFTRFRLFALFHAVSFSVISLWILGLNYLMISLALVYFLLMILSGLTGFLISVLSRGKSWAFIAIPILIIPQLIFSGALIRWADFPGWERSDKAPVYSRFVPSSYAFEALMTESVLRNPDFSWEDERIHYLSLVYLQEILPEYEHLMKSEASQSYEESFRRSLSPELLMVFEESENSEDLKGIFESNFHKELTGKHHLPVVWRFLQNYDTANELDWKDTGVYSGQYAFYQLGNVRYDKSAYVTFLGLKMPHVIMSLLILFLMCLPLVTVLFFYPFKWPY